MTSLPDTSAPGQKKLGLVIDLDTCVGCQACATSCKEWNTQGYSRIVQNMIGYANYVDKQRKEEPAMDSDDAPEPVIFEKGPGGLPLLPMEVKGLRGSMHEKSLGHFS